MGDGYASSSVRASCTLVENRTALRLGVIPPPLESESASDGVMSPGLSERELLLPESEPFLLGSSLSISSLSFPGNDVAGALRTDLGVDGPLDVRVESEASDADAASVALSAVDGRVVFLSEERVGGGGRIVNPEGEAGREVCLLGTPVRCTDRARDASTLRRGK